MDRRDRGGSIIGGGGIFIYSCSQSVKTIDFKKNYDAQDEYINIAPPPNYRPSAVPGPYNFICILITKL